ncbi:rhomboid family intramembrane serine protease [Curtobacterium sp. SGAir0471]|uniref:rhomboid family intramembrane serine protease n=1 Tax=Curtobacterium sp. SGAir0471 TaxID=2070337 RepID=UPI0010CCC60D|nr:rhomboid family intramembrane serine protease [Curtobacterium sp. SGAir0471]QCR43393.1 rhomboid family intramembrane serine protease [Curtobacterium sp. SGAir0471]
MTASLPVLGLVLVLCGAVVVGRSSGQGGDRRPPVATLVSLAVVAVPTVLQLLVLPTLLAAWERDWPRMLDGQWWRLVTSLTVQDDGWPGAVLNLLSLAVVGFLAERTWGRRSFVVIALVSGVGAQFWGAVVQPVGAGNSVVVVGLAASLAVARVRTRSTAVRAVAIGTLVVGAALFVTGDLHGGAFVLGAVCALVITIRRRATGHAAPAGGTEASSSSVQG